VSRGETEDRAPGAWARLEVGLPWVALVALACVTSLQKIRSFDYWWQLRAGQWIVENGQVPRTDPFSYTAQGAPWLDIHWLFQVALQAVHRLGGHEAVVLAKLLVVAGVVGVGAAFARSRDRAGLAPLCLGLLLLVACDRFLARPELPSFLCLSVVLLLLDREERRSGAPDAWLWLVLPVQLVWVNMHGLFALGIALCAMYLAGEIARPLWHRQVGLRVDRIRRFGTLTAGATALALANPNGLEGALYPVVQLGMIGTESTRGLFGEAIRELRPPVGPGGVAEPLLVGLAAALLVLALGVLWLNRRRLVPAHLLVLTAFTFLALAAVRNLALFAVVVAPLSIRNGGEWLSEHPLAPRARRIGSFAVSAWLAAAVLAVASGAFFDGLGVDRKAGLGLQEGVFPLGPVNWIERERPPGRIAHHMADGGLILARLYPDYRVMLDGRLEVYGAERFAELTVTGPERLDELDARYGLGSVLVHHSLRPPGGLLWSLYVDRRWRLVWLDEVAALFVRVPDGADPAAFAPGWSAVDVDDPAVPAAQPTRGLADLKRRVARANLFLSLRRYDRALDEWREIDRVHPGRVGSRGVIAKLERIRSGVRARRAALEDALRRNEDPALLASLAALDLEQGRLEDARRHYRRALELDPEHPRVLLERARLAEAEHDRTRAERLYGSLLAGGRASVSQRERAEERLRSLSRPPGS
jgi:tetratricopeptide (TPR) repeat protein